MRFARLARIAVLLGLALGLAAAAPIAWIETRCVTVRADGGPAYAPILPPADRRVEVDTYLTYPEWSIVHAYEDLAAVSRARGESAFAYASSVAGYWRGLCAVVRTASARGEIPSDTRTMLHVIGISFSAEMAVKGAWESTLGALAEAVRGGAPTPEDTFSHAVSDDYAAFLRQAPWYAYPFGPTLARFWREVPWQGGHPVRKVERRVALSLEYGVKAVYAKALGALAGLSPAASTLRSVVRGLDAGDLAVDARIVLVERRADGTSVIETPRYRAYTEILAGLAARGRDLVEIAGNDEVMLTVLAPAGAQPPAGAVPLLAVPVQARHGSERVALAVRVDALCALLRGLQGGVVSLEHVYDY
ncbi:MAG: hypothetical protein NTW15_14935 [Burkholderiales bacterium]|nr:hypothetical protein [Burkholderiales bacterium]